MKSFAQLRRLWRQTDRPVLALAVLVAGLGGEAGAGPFAAVLEEAPSWGAGPWIGALAAVLVALGMLRSRQDGRAG